MFSALPPLGRGTMGSLSMPDASDRLCVAPSAQAPAQVQRTVPAPISMRTHVKYIILIILSEPPVFNALEPVL